MILYLFLLSPYCQIVLDTVNIRATWTFLSFFPKRKLFCFCLLVYSYNKVIWDKSGSDSLEKGPGSNYFNFAVFVVSVVVL